MRCARGVFARQIHHFIANSHMQNSHIKGIKCLPIKKILRLISEQYEHTPGGMICTMQMNNKNGFAIHISCYIDAIKLQDYKMWEKTAGHLINKRG